MQSKKIYEDGYYVNSTEIEKKWRDLECISAYLCVHFFSDQSRKTYFWKDTFVYFVYFFSLKLVGAFDVLNMFF